MREGSRSTSPDSEWTRTGEERYKQKQTRERTWRDKETGFRVSEIEKQRQRSSESLRAVSTETHQERVG